jgi:hypothetical protein
MTFRVTCVNSAGVSAFDEKTVTVTGPTCPTSIDYNPGDRIIRVGQVITLTVSNWPASSTCQPFWYVSDASRAHIVGGDSVVVIDGKQYFGGVRGNLRGIYQGTVDVCVQTSLVTPQVAKCYPWTVTSTPPPAMLVDTMVPELPYNEKNTPDVNQMYQP